MPEPAPASHDSRTWRALVELTVDTVRPGSSAESDPASGER
jgi:hypothetical protein